MNLHLCGYVEQRLTLSKAQHTVLHRGPLRPSTMEYAYLVRKTDVDTTEITDTQHHHRTIRSQCLLMKFLRPGLYAGIVDVAYIVELLVTDRMCAAVHTVQETSPKRLREAISQITPLGGHTGPSVMASCINPSVFSVAAGSSFFGTLT